LTGCSDCGADRSSEVAAGTRAVHSSLLSIVVFLGTTCSECRAEMTASPYALSSSTGSSPADMPSGTARIGIMRALNRHQ
jgi:hypothetical protein